jgi:hypothetical protein
MLLAYKLIEQACDMIGEGLRPDQFMFTWMCDTWQFHGFKSLAYLFASNQDKFMRISDKKWDENVGRTFEINGIKRELRPIDELFVSYWVLVQADRNRTGWQGYNRI